MTDRLRAAFRDQSEACRGLGSPFMARLMALCADRLAPGTPLTDRLFDWPGDLGPGAESVPLRLAGALHALRRAGRGGLDPVYPPHDVDADRLWAVVEEALRSEAAYIDRFIDSPPQTNEVRRSVALLAAGHWLTGQRPLPLSTWEIGASAGLNLNWDLYAVRAGDTRLGAAEPVLTLRPDWRGPVPDGPAPRVARRRGVDLAPLDPRRDGDRLRAYLWPDQPDRIALTDAAIAAAGPAPERGDAVTWLTREVSLSPGHWTLIYHTVAWQYLGAADRAAGEARIATLGATASEGAPLARLGMENDGAGPGAALTVTTWPGGVTTPLARVDFHGRWIDWTAT